MISSKIYIWVVHLPGLFQYRGVGGRGSLVLLVAGGGAPLGAGAEVDCSPGGGTVVDSPGSGDTEVEGVSEEETAVEDCSVVAGAEVSCGVVEDSVVG